MLKNPQIRIEPYDRAKRVFAFLQQKTGYETAIDIGHRFDDNFPKYFLSKNRKREILYKLTTDFKLKEINNEIVAQPVYRETREQIDLQYLVTHLFTVDQVLIPTTETIYWS